MAMKLNEPVRSCKIITSGPIPILGNIAGPISKCRLTTTQIVSAMRCGHRVAEYNPADPKECIELTLDDNCASPFGKPQKPAKTTTKEHVCKAPEPKVEEVVVPPTPQEPIVEVAPEIPVEEVPAVAEISLDTVPNEEVYVPVETPEVVEPMDESAPESTVKVENENRSSNSKKNKHKR